MLGYKANCFYVQGIYACDIIMRIVLGEKNLKKKHNPCLNQIDY